MNPDKSSDSDELSEEPIFTESLEEGQEDPIVVSPIEQAGERPIGIEEQKTIEEQEKQNKTTARTGSSVGLRSYQISSINNLM